MVTVRRYCGLDWAQVLLVKGSWLTMFGLAVGLSYQNNVVTIGSFILMLVVLAAQWHAWQRGGESSLRHSIADSKPAELAA